MSGNPTPTAVIAAAEDRVVKPHRTAALIARLDNLLFHATLPQAGHETLYELPAYKTTLQNAFDALRDSGRRADRRSDKSLPYPMIATDGSSAGAIRDE
jgi:alpha-beta hydrolase superfamily lysophospholipase